MKNAVYCIAQDRASAESIVDNLRSAGISSSEISVLMADKSGTRDFAHEQNTKLPEGAATGGVAGMGAGAILGWLAGIGSLAIPGVGPFIAAGPIMAALGGAAIGGAAGGVIGALVGMGIPEYEAKLYDGKIRGGNALISVYTDNADQVKKVKKIYEEEGILGLYTGITSAIIQTFSGNFSYFFWYRFIRGRYLVNGKPISTIKELAIGAVAGALCQITTIPISVVVTRQQTTSKTTRKSLVGTWNEILGESGLTGFLNFL